MGTRCTAGALSPPYFATGHGNDCDDGDASVWLALTYQGYWPQRCGFLRLGLGAGAASAEVVATIGDYVPVPQRRHARQDLRSHRTSDRALQAADDLGDPDRVLCQNTID